MDATDLTVIIPTRSRWDILQRTLDALAQQTAQGFDVIVVVDGLDEEPPTLEGARVLTKAHGGPGAARNFGVAHTSRALVLFLGDDMIPDTDMVERHLARHTEEPAPHVGVLGLAEWQSVVCSGRSSASFPCYLRARTSAASSNAVQPGTTCSGWRPPSRSRGSKPLRSRLAARPADASKRSASAAVGANSEQRQASAARTRGRLQRSSGSRSQRVTRTSATARDAIDT